MDRGGGITVGAALNHPSKRYALCVLGAELRAVQVGGHLPPQSDTRLEGGRNLGKRSVTH